MTDQTFDERRQAREVEARIIAHIKSMGHRSAVRIQGEDICLYRGKEGSRCAVGCLIPDDIYRKEIEKYGLSFLDVRDGKWVSDPINRSIGAGYLADVLNRSNIPASAAMKHLLDEWQSRHDDKRNWNEDGYCGPIHPIDFEEVGDSP